MVLGLDTCGLPGCNRVLSPIRIVCQNCLEVPDSDIYSPRTNYGYCCYEHREWDKTTHAITTCCERKVWRTMVRVAAICNMVVMCVQMKMYLFHITFDHVVSSKVREVGIEWRMNAQNGEQWWPEGMWHPGILAAVSVDNCIFGIKLVTPLLAWLLQDIPLRIDEHSARPIKSRQIHINYLNNTWSPIAKYHDFFTMTPTLNAPHIQDGITVDVSSMQYENTVRSHKASLYRNTMIQQVKAIKPFGTSFNMHRVNLENEGGAEADRQATFLLEVDLRTMNNAVFTEAQRLGGRPYLFSMQHNDFLCALDSIGRVLCGALTVLRPKVEPVVFRMKDWAVFRQLIDDCAGEGHQVIMKALGKREENEE